MKEKKFMIKIFFTIFFIFSQSITWELISNFIPKTFEGYNNIYPAFQIMFAECYIWGSICFTHDNEHLKKFLANPKIYKFVDKILDLCVIIIESVIRLALIIPEVFSSSKDSFVQIEIQKQEVLSNVQKYKKNPIELRLLAIICAIMIFSIFLFDFCDTVLLHYYSEIMNLGVSILSFIIVLRNVEIPKLEKCNN